MDPPNATTPSLEGLPTEIRTAVIKIALTDSGAAILLRQKPPARTACQPPLRRKRSIRPSYSIATGLTTGSLRLIHTGRKIRREVLPLICRDAMFRLEPGFAAQDVHALVKEIPWITHMQKLTMGCAERLVFLDWSASVPLLASMHPFNDLKRLEIDLSCVCGWPGSSRHISKIDRFVRRCDIARSGSQ